jgi:hypothetical protein
MNHQMIMTTTKNFKRLFIILVMINCLAPIKQSYADKRKLTVAFVAKNVSCNGLHDGTISLNVKGGTAPYQVNWSHGASSLILNDLSAGVYDVTVTDADGNVVQQSVSIAEPYPLSIHGNTVAEQCAGKNGAVTILVTGGVYPAAYNWSNGSVAQNLENVSAGDYTVNVTDANGCRTNASFNVMRKRNLALSVEKYNPLCANDETGLIDLTVHNGEQPFSFKWNTLATSEDISGLAAGTYSVVVTDKNNCAATIDVTLQNPKPITIEPVIADALPGKNNGSIALNVSGGAGGYSFLWSTMDNKDWLKNLEEGVYAVKVTDKNGCFESDFYSVKEIAPLKVTANVYNLLCYDDNTGMIDLNITGGKVPYSIKWSNGLVFEDLAGVAAGNYTVEVADANGKTVSKSFTIHQPDALTVFATVADETAYAKANGSIKLDVTGGTAPYMYTWTNGYDEQNYTNASPGTYTVLVTDAHRCEIKHEMMVATQITDEAAVAAPANVYEQMMRITKAESDMDNTIAVFPNPFNSSFTIKFSSDVKQIESISIFTLDGKLIYTMGAQSLKINGNTVLVNNINISNGNYFVKISTNDKTFSKIITRQH